MLRQGSRFRAAPTGASSWSLWKLITFLVSGGVVTLIGPYTGDPTWDRVDGFFMSVFCYVSAPWVVATIYQFFRKQATAIGLYVAVIAWLFTASWSYDIYLVWRDGDYPITWGPNILASSLIYICAGLFWNLEWKRDRGVIFSFMREGWPSRPEVSAPWRFIVPAAILATPVVASVLLFIL